MIRYMPRLYSHQFHTLLHVSPTAQVCVFFVLQKLSLRLYQISKFGSAHYLIIVKLNFIKNTTVCFMQQLESLKRRFPSTTYLQLPQVYISATNTEWTIMEKNGTREAQIDFPFRKAENIQIRQPQ